MIFDVNFLNSINCVHKMLVHRAISKKAKGPIPSYAGHCWQQVFSSQWHHLCGPGHVGWPINSTPSDNIRDVPDIGYYPVSGQESGIQLDPVSGTKQYPVLSGILYLVKSYIRYYPVHYQLLPNTAATDLYGI